MASNSSSLRKKMKETEEAFSNFTLSIHAELQLIQSKDMEKQGKLQELENSVNQHTTQLSDYTTHKEKMQKLENNIKQAEDRLDIFTMQLSVESEKLGTSLSELLCELSKSKSNGTLNSCCPVGWVQYSKSCYFISTSTKSWNDAKQFCISKGSALVSINTIGEQTFLRERTVPFYTWIGLSDATGVWAWADGSDYSSGPKFWILGQPDDYYWHEFGDREDCAHLHADGKWNDEHCSRLYRWICEKKSEF